MTAFVIHYCGWLARAYIFPPRNTPSRYSLGLQYFALTFESHVDWYSVQRWPKREVLKRKTDLAMYIDVADCRVRIYSYPKISPPRLSFRLQYYTLIFRAHADCYLLKRWTKWEVLKRRWEGPPAGGSSIENHDDGYYYSWFVDGDDAAQAQAHTSRCGRWPWATSSLLSIRLLDEGAGAGIR